MGRQYGEQCREQIRELLTIRLTSALSHAAARGKKFSQQQALVIAAENLTKLKLFHPEGYRELLGISEGSNITMAELYILQGLTDFRDFLSWGKTPDGLGCTSLIITRERSHSGQLILAQNWDLQTSNMPYVCFVKRKPFHGPQSLSLTIAGGLSMIGLNSEGVAIGTNNIKTKDARQGVHYLNLIHKVMTCKSTTESKNLIHNAIRSGAHYFLIGDANGEYCGLECSATHSEEILEKNGIVTHCNHPLHSAIAELSAEDMGPSTCHRQKRVDELSDKKNFNIESIKNILSDHKGGDLAICRHDVDEGISTNASVIIEPEKGVIHACRSNAHEGIWQSFSF